MRPLGLIIGFYLLVFFLLAILQAAGVAVFGESALDASGVAVQWITLTSTLIATWVMLRRVEKLPWRTIGLHTEAAAPPVLAEGAAYGALAIGVASMALVAVQQLQIVPAPDGSWWGTAGRATAILFPAAFFEELFIRGYAFSVLRRMSGWKLALLVTSVVFGLLHAANPGANAQSILSVTIAGFFLGALFLATGSLYAATAAHFAWNWVMAGLLHTPVSGLVMPTPDYKTVDAGPDWLTGGPWGPESGLASIAIMFILLFYLHHRHLRRMEPNA
ncbi:MAG: CPBP family intramembrane metalloprotease [Gemmatimonadota bacterium]|nr:CPBP family intramembrane metalloprotease [Gemmatimonadota bacterium]